MADSQVIVKVKKERTVPTYFVFLVAAIMGIGVFVNIGYTSIVEARQKTADAANLRAAQEAQKQASLIALKAMCDVISAQVNGYKETPPTTPTGLNLQKSWTDIYQTFGCAHI